MSRTGKKIVEASKTITPTGAGNVATTIRFDDLNQILYVISYKVNCNPATNANVVSEHVGTTPHDYNVVGVTVYVGAGTTLTVTAYAYGV